MTGDAALLAAWERVSGTAWQMAGHEGEHLPVDDDIALITKALRALRPALTECEIALHPNFGGSVHAQMVAVEAILRDLCETVAPAGEPLEAEPVAWEVRCSKGHSKLTDRRSDYSICRAVTSDRKVCRALVTWHPLVRPS